MSSALKNAPAELQPRPSIPALYPRRRTIHQKRLPPHGRREAMAHFGAVDLCWNAAYRFSRLKIRPGMLRTMNMMTAQNAGT